MTLDTSVDAVAGALEANLAELLRLRLVVPVVVQAPAAGAEWSATPPAGATWELLSACGVLTSSAVVGNRRATLRVLDPVGNVVARYENSAVQAAGVADPYTWLAGIGAVISGSGIEIPIADPPQVVSPGYSIGTLTSNLDVGDQWSAIVLSVRQWSAEAIVRNAEWIARRFPDFAVQP